VNKLRISSTLQKWLQLSSRFPYFPEQKTRKILLVCPHVTTAILHRWNLARGIPMPTKMNLLTEKHLSLSSAAKDLD